MTGQTLIADGGMSLGAMVHASAFAEPASETEEEPLIAIVGAGAVAPGANDPDELWDVLAGEQHKFVEPTRFDASAFHSTDPDVEDRSYTRTSGFITGFRPGPRLAAELETGTVPSRETTTLWLRHSLHTALEQVRRRTSDRWFAAFGFTADGSQELEEHLVRIGYRRLFAEAAGRLSEAVARRLDERYRTLDAPAAEWLPHRIGRNTIAGVLPESTELVMIDTACSSSLYSIDLAVKALREGVCDVAVAGGAFAYTARNVVLFSKLTGLSKDGMVRCFDQGATGVLFSDGAATVILKRLDRARADGDRILGVVDGIGLACDGRGKAIYAPNQRGQRLALERAYAEADASPAELSWVIGHATGTQAGDSTEVGTLNAAAGDGPPALLSSNKAIVGHTGWACGAISVVQAVTGIAHGSVPAQRYLTETIPALRGSRFTVPTKPAALDASPDGRPPVVGVNAFGFGGTDAHLVLAGDDPARSAVRRRPAVATEPIVVVGWSTHLPEGGAASFGDDYPLPGFDEVPLPPPTLRGMDRTQTMVARCERALPEAVRQACAQLRDTVGVIAGHRGPTRRAVHYALRCYLGDLEQTLEGCPEPDGDLESALKLVADRVRALVPPSTEDSFPGIMPNIIPARLAALSDYRGLNATVDTGPDSALDALRTAERYLRHRDLDLALVVGVNGNSTPELADVVAGAGTETEVCEGAFMVALVRASTARELGLPVLGTISTQYGRTDPATRPAVLAPLADSGRTYLGADALAAVVSRLRGGAGTARIGAAAPWGTQVVLVVAAPEGGRSQTGAVVTRPGGYSVTGPKARHDRTEPDQAASPVVRM